MSEPGFVDLGFARVDIDRRRRCGFPEVIFGIGKTPIEVLGIAREILAREPVLLVSRARPKQRSLHSTLLVLPRCRAKPHPLPPRPARHLLPRLRQTNSANSNLPC